MNRKTRQLPQDPPDPEERPEYTEELLDEVLLFWPEDCDAPCLPRQTLQTIVIDDESIERVRRSFEAKMRAADSLETVSLKDPTSLDSFSRRYGTTKLMAASLVIVLLGIVTVGVCLFDYRFWRDTARTSNQRPSLEKGYRLVMSGDWYVDSEPQMLDKQERKLAGFVAGELPRLAYSSRDIVEPKFIEKDWAELESQGGPAFRIAGMSVSQKREHLVFSDPYFETHQAIVTRTERAPDIIKSLKGSGKVAGKIVVQENTTSVETAMDCASGEGEITQCHTNEGSFEMLRRNQVDLWIVDVPFALEQILKKKETAAELSLLVLFCRPEKYAIGIPKQTSHLRDHINQILDAQEVRKLTAEFKAVEKDKQDEFERCDGNVVYLATPSAAMTLTARIASRKDYPQVRPTQFAWLARSRFRNLTNGDVQREVLCWHFDLRRADLVIGPTAQICNQRDQCAGDAYRRTVERPTRFFCRF